MHGKCTPLPNFVILRAVMNFPFTGALSVGVQRPGREVIRLMSRSRMRGAIRPLPIRLQGVVLI